MSGERMVGPHPAVVISYDNASRTCRVRIPAITDGGAVGALAQICYPIGKAPK
jgi:mRNA-degrading endonuclease toxin of MazEF toxin-antitoxin module